MFGSEKSRGLDWKSLSKLPDNTVVTVPLSALKPTVPNDHTESHHGREKIKVTVEVPPLIFRALGVKPYLRIQDGNTRYWNLLDNGAKPNTNIEVEIDREFFEYETE